MRARHRVQTVGGYVEALSREAAEDVAAALADAERARMQTTRDELAPYLDTIEHLRGQARAVGVELPAAPVIDGEHVEPAGYRDSAAYVAAVLPVAAPRGHGVREARLVEDLRLAREYEQWMRGRWLAACAAREQCRRDRAHLTLFVVFAFVTLFVAPSLLGWWSMVLVIPLWTWVGMGRLHERRQAVRRHDPRRPDALEFEHFIALLDLHHAEQAVPLHVAWPQIYGAPPSADG